jgi:hypothetical protein
MNGIAEISHLAETFITRHQHELRYINNRWHQWNGTSWEPEGTLLVIDKARTICRERAEEMTSQAAARSLGSYATVSRVVSMAKRMGR